MLEYPLIERKDIVSHKHIVIVTPVESAFDRILYLLSDIKCIQDWISYRANALSRVI